MQHIKGAKWECRQEAPEIKKYVIGLSYGEFYGGSFELFFKIFHRLDPDIFEFEIPTAVILLNGTSKKKVVRFWRKWYQSPGNYQEWGKSVFRSKSWFFWKIEYPWLGRALSTLSFRTLDIGGGCWFRKRPASTQERHQQVRTDPPGGAGCGKFTALRVTPPSASFSPALWLLCWNTCSKCRVEFPLLSLHV